VVFGSPRPEMPAPTMLSKKMTTALPFVFGPLCLMVLKLLFTYVPLDYLIGLMAAGCLVFFARRAQVAHNTRSFALAKEKQLEEMIAEEERLKTLEDSRKQLKRQKALRKQQLRKARTAKSSKKNTASGANSLKADAQPSSSDDDDFLAQWSQNQRKSSTRNTTQGTHVTRKRNNHKLRANNKLYDAAGMGQMTTNLKDMACPGTNPDSQEPHTDQWLESPLEQTTVEPAKWGNAEEGSASQPFTAGQEPPTKVSSSAGGGAAKRGNGDTAPVGVIGDGRKRSRGRRSRRKRPSGSRTAQ